jgi:hypothetical protein
MSSVDDAIKRELIIIYKKQFGYKWLANLHKQLVPSPMRFLSVVYSVPIDYIYFMHNQLVQQFKITSSVSTINASL